MFNKNRSIFCWTCARKVNLDFTGFSLKRSWFQIFRYVKSKNDEQLLHGLGYNDTSSCKPEESNNGLPVVPCGLIAWSLFNDTYTLIRGRSELKVNRKNIAWKSDRDHKFGKNVYPFNFQNGTLMGGGKLDPRIPVSITTVQKSIEILFSAPIWYHHICASIVLNLWNFLELLVIATLFY